MLLASAAQVRTPSHASLECQTPFLASPRRLHATDIVCAVTKASDQMQALVDDRHVCPDAISSLEVSLIASDTREDRFVVGPC